MDFKKYIIALIVLIAAFSAGRFSSPKKVEIVEKYAYATSEMIDRAVNRTVTEKETRLPDGTIIKERTETKESQIRKERETEEKREITKVIENRPEIRLGMIYEPAIKGFQESGYSLMVEKRLFSEIYLGVSYSSENTVGLVLSLGF